MKHLISLKTNQGTATIEEYKKGNLQWYLPCLYELGTIIAYRD